jgi:hypothetical protein
MSEKGRTALLRFTIRNCEEEGVKTLKKNRKVDLQNAKAADRTKLAWEVRRQVQQEILEKKLVQCFLKPRSGSVHLQRYPEAMQPMIADFMRKAEERTKLHCV